MLHLRINQGRGQRRERPYSGLKLEQILEPQACRKLIVEALSRKARRIKLLGGLGKRKAKRK